MKKVIRLTESDLIKIVNRVIKEDDSEKIYTFKLGNCYSYYPESKKATYKIHTEGGENVKGKPVIVKNGRDILLTENMTITPEDTLKFKQGDEVTMRSIVADDIRRRSKQVVNLSIQNGKPELFVYTD